MRANIRAIRNRTGVDFLFLSSNCGSYVVKRFSQSYLSAYTLSSSVTQFLPPGHYEASYANKWSVHSRQGNWRMKKLPRQHPAAHRDRRFYSHSAAATVSNSPPCRETTASRKVFYKPTVMIIWKRNPNWSGRQPKFFKRNIMPRWDMGAARSEMTPTSTPYLRMRPSSIRERDGGWKPI